MKKRKKKKKNYYFKQIHEDAIIEYALTSDRKRREELYIKLIGPVLNELVDNIVYTYKFNVIPNIDIHKEDCKVWLITILSKFDPNKGFKAFSYFSVITKNWFVHKIKVNSQKAKREFEYGGSHLKNFENDLVIYNDYDDRREKEEFFKHLLEEMSCWYAENFKTNDIKVLKAVIELFEKSDKIELFNKKAIYVYLRELTNLNQKQLASILTKFRTLYSEFKIDWERDIF